MGKLLDLPAAKVCSSGIEPIPASRDGIQTLGCSLSSNSSEALQIATAAVHLAGADLESFWLNLF